MRGEKAVVLSLMQLMTYPFTIWTEDSGWVKDTLGAQWSSPVWELHVYLPHTSTMAVDTKPSRFGKDDCLITWCYTSCMDSLQQSWLLKVIVCANIVVKFLECEMNKYLTFDL
jgi:hypothetical protein